MLGRNIDYVQSEGEYRPIREAFVDRIDIAPDGPPWPARLALLPTRGALDAEGLNGCMGYEYEEQVPMAESHDVTIHTVCVQTTAAADLRGD